MKNIRNIIVFILTILLIEVLNISIGSMLPIGKLPDPFHGYLVLIGSNDTRIIQPWLAELHQPVWVVIDELCTPPSPRASV